MRLKELLKYQSGGLTVDKIQNIINKYSNGKSPLTANDYMDVSRSTGVPVDLLLAQGIQESNFGTKGKAVRTMNVGNVGNTDSGAANYQNSWKTGLLRQANLLKQEYKVGNSSDIQRLVNNDFVRPNKGGRYASDPNYGASIGKLLNTIHGKKVYDLNGKIANPQTNIQYASTTIDPNLQPVDWNQNKEDDYLNSVYKYDFSTLPPNLQQTVTDNQELQNEKLNQEIQADALQKQNMVIEQALAQKSLEREQLIKSIPQAEFVGSGMKRNDYSQLLQNPTPTFQQGGQINGDGINNVLSKLNPKNWFKTDYSDKGTYSEAYSAARNDGESEFMYKGKRYNTNYNGTPQQQLQQTGITDSQKGTRNIVQERLANNLYPGGYDDMVNRVKSTVVDNKKEEQRKWMDDNSTERWAKNRKDAFNLYLGKPQTDNTFAISDYRPSKEKNKDDLYYKINEDNFYYGDGNIFQNLMADIQSKSKVSSDKPLENNLKKVSIDSYGNIMGDFTISTGKDDRGNYISYYDKWDLAPANFGKPYEIYDRLYYNIYKDKSGKPYRGQMFYTDDELKSLNIDDKNTNIRKLQKELYQRGYDLSNSIKKDKNEKNNIVFDGITGDETKAALQKFRNDQKR